MNNQKVVLSVKGMSCAGCESQVAQALTKLEGVSSVSVSLQNQLAQVQGENLDAAALVSAVEQAGFQAQTNHQDLSN